MAQTFRRGKIEDYYQTLRVRRAVLANQMKREEFADMTDQIKGEIRMIDLVMSELKQEFGIKDKWDTEDN